MPGAGCLPRLIWNAGQSQAIRQTFSGEQLSFFGPETHPLVEDLRDLKIEELSPLEALNKLYELQQQAKDA